MNGYRTLPALAFGASLVGPWFLISGKFRIQETTRLCFEMLFVCVEDEVMVL